MRKIAVLVIVPAVYPYVSGGFEIATFKLVNRLAERGVEVLLAAECGKSGNAKQLKARLRLIANFLRYPLSLFVFIPWLIFVSLYDRKRYRVMHIHPIAWYFAPLVLIAKLLKRHVVLWGRGGDIYTYNWRNVFEKFLIKSMISHADVVLALSRDMKERIEAISGRRDVIVIPNGVDLAFIRKIKRVQRDLLLSKILSLEPYLEDIKLLLYAGRLIEFKGVEYLIAAMSEVLKKMKHTYLIIVGDGPLKNELLTLSQKLNLERHVIFLGKVQHETLLSWLPSFDVFIYPELRGQGISNAVLESMALGIPVIASNVGGLPEIVIHRKTGLLVPPKSSTHIASAIIELLTNHTLKEKIIFNAKRIVLTQFNLDVVVSKLFTLYQKFS